MIMTYGLWIKRQTDPEEKGHWHTCRGAELCLFNEKEQIQELLKDGYDNCFVYSAMPYTTKLGAVPRTHMGHMHGLPRYESIHCAGRPIVGGPKNGFNPSVVTQDNGQILCYVRGPDSTNFMGYLEPDTGNLRRVRELRDEKDSGWSYEDLRLFYRGGELWATAAAVEMRRPRMTILKLEEGYIAQSYVQQSPHDEKNWIPAVVGNSLKLVYAIEPELTVLTFDDEKKKVTPAVSTLTAATRWTRGGTQLIPWDGGLLGAVHYVFLEQGYPIYLHKLVRFDRELSTYTLSRFFFFFAKGIEFASGITETDDGGVLFTFGAADRTAHLALVRPDEIERLFSDA